MKSVIEKPELKTFPKEEIRLLFEKEDLSLLIAGNSRGQVTAVESMLKQ
jgi:hypothetical protein